MFKQLFESWGWRCFLGSPDVFTFDAAEHCLKTRAGERIDFVYNRLTDFMLQESTHRHLRLAYLAGRTCFSPNPHEYLLLADKQRLVEISRPGWLEQLGAPPETIAAIRTVLPPTIDMEHHADTEQLWRERKQLFFKPKQSYGGKGAFRGASISRKMFDQLRGQGYIAQQFIPPGTLNVTTADGAIKEFKYDARFYAYRDEVQLMVARVYQGQVTNLRIPGGGFASLRLVS